MQQTELLPKEDKAQQPYVFYFNKCFVNAGFVAIAGADLAQISSQIKVKEEEFMEEINPWNREVNLLVKELNSHDSIMKEGKDDREAASKVKVSIEVKANKAKVGVNTTKVEIIITK